MILLARFTAPVGGVSTLALSTTQQQQRAGRSKDKRAGRGHRHGCKCEQNVRGFCDRGERRCRCCSRGRRRSSTEDGKPEHGRGADPTEAAAVLLRHTAGSSLCLSRVTDPRASVAREVSRLISLSAGLEHVGIELRGPVADMFNMPRVSDRGMGLCGGIRRPCGPVRRGEIGQDSGDLPAATVSLCYHPTTRFPVPRSRPRHQARPVRRARRVPTT